MNEFLINFTIFSLLHGSALLSSTAEDEGIPRKKPQNNYKITSISTKISICLNMMDSFFSIKDPFKFMISTICITCMLILMEYTFTPWPISSNSEKSTGLRWYFVGFSACSGNMMPFFTPSGLEEHLFVVRTPISLLATFSLCMFTVYNINI